MSETTELKTSLRMRPRVSGEAAAVIRPVVRVRFAHWQPIPAVMAARTPGAIFSARKNCWRVQMFTVLAAVSTPMPGGVVVAAGSTVSLATFEANGFAPKIEPVTNDFSDLDVTPVELARRAVNDMIADGELNLALTAAEGLVVALKNKILAAHADAAGVFTA